MEEFILWIGFIGSWLLFAGPIYQAALELKEQDIEIDRIRAATKSIERPPKISIWWWLLPPIKFILERRRSDEYRRAHIASLSPEDAASLLTFMNKASAWMFVASGGLCIALKETYELAEHNEWSSMVYGAIILSLILLSIANLVVRIKRSSSILEAVKNKD